MTHTHRLKDLVDLFPLNGEYGNQQTLYYNTATKGWDTDILPGRVYDVMVSAYGARGDDATDDTDALQLAIDTAEADGGGVVWLPEGVYRHTGLILRSHVILQGTGNTVLKNTHATNPSLDADTISQFAVRDLTLTATATTPPAFTLTDVTQCEVNRVVVTGHGDGVTVLGSSTQNPLFGNVSFSGNSGTDLIIGDVDTAPASVVVVNPVFSGEATRTAVSVVAGSGHTLLNPRWETYSKAISAASGSLLTVINPTVSSVTTFATLGSTDITSSPWWLIGNGSNAYSFGSDGLSRSVGSGDVIPNQRVVATVKVEGISGSFAGDSKQVSVTVTGAALGNVVDISPIMTAAPPTDTLPTHFTWSAWVSASDTVSIRFLADDVGANISDRFWKVIVWNV